MSENSYQLLIAIVQDLDAANVSECLISAGFAGPTRVPAIGGFLQQGNSALLLAVPVERVTEALRMIAAGSRSRAQYVNPLPPFVQGALASVPYPIELQIGAATVFILGIERFERW